MKDFISCFSEQAVQVADCASSSSSSWQVHRLKAGGAAAGVPCAVTDVSSSSSSSNSKTVCNVYQLALCGSPLLVTVTWSSHGLLVELGSDDEELLGKDDVENKSLWRKRKGFRRVQIGASALMADIAWDLTEARFGRGGSPEPLDGFHVTVASGNEILLQLGDLGGQEYFSNVNPSFSALDALVCRKEHVYGKGFYCVRSQLCKHRAWHDIAIECCPGEGLYGVRVWVDRDLAMEVRHLLWNFRGNRTITVDGADVDVLWDVHDWFFGTNGPPRGHGVFMFRTSSLVSSCPSLALPCPGGRGFSLLVHAWRTD